MADRFDAIVVGMGPGGEVVATRLLDAGRRVAVVERELIGGECSYWACIPSKTLLRAPETRSMTDRVAGGRAGPVAWAELRDYRDRMIRHLDDSAQVAEYERSGATVVRGSARLTGPGQVEVAGQPLSAEHIIIATGSEALRPPIEGLDEVPVWTNREATVLRDIPARALLVGGGPVGVELGQFLARMGSQVTVVERAARLLAREEPKIGEQVEQALRADGVDVRVGRQVVRASRDGDTTLVTLDDAAVVAVDVIVLGVGRRPRTAGLGLDRVGVELDEQGALRVDSRCQVSDGLWAVGDVTNRGLYTHLAKYQARVAADAILGRPRRASYEGVPRVSFTDPEVAAVGLTTEQAHRQGLTAVTAEVDLAATLSRPSTYETEPRGRLAVIADRDRRVLVGAWVVSPLASEIIHFAALAIRAGIGIDTLLDTVPQFPTYTEGYLSALESLRL